MRSGMFKKVVALVLLVSLLSITAMAEFDAYVLNSKMKVYFAPSTKSEKIGSLPQTTEVTVEATSGEWALINYKGYKGYAKVEDMVSEEPVAKMKTAAKTAIYYITPDNLTPRWNVLPADTTVYIRGMKDNLALVSNKDFTVLGYVQIENLK